MEPGRNATEHMRMYMGSEEVGDWKSCERLGKRQEKEPVLVAHRQEQG